MLLLALAALLTGFCIGLYLATLFSTGRIEGAYLAGADAGAREATDAAFKAGASATRVMNEDEAERLSDLLYGAKERRN